jgi:iron complex outermembrane receptor protein
MDVHGTTDNFRGNTMVKRRNGIAIGATIVSAFAAHGALAQQASNSSAATQNGMPTEVTDVVVTAERHTELLNKVPIAASVVSGDELQERDVKTIGDLVTQTPSLSIENTGLLDFVNIRGVGLQATNPATSSGVAIYSDGFFIPHETAINDSFYDVNQVEVLRGPQGTLVGQSSTGGAMFATSVKPDFDGINGYIQQTIGNYSTYRTEGAANLPLSDTLAVRVAGHIDSRDSFFKDISTTTGSDHPGDFRGVSGRIGVKWDPTSNLDIYLKSELDEHHGGGIPGKPFGEIAGTSPSVLADPALKNPFTIDYNTPESDSYHLWRTSLEINWGIANGLTLRSLSGYQTVQTRSVLDQDFNDVANSYLSYDIGETTYEQELDLISDFTGNINFIVGAFYLHDQVPTALVNDGGTYGAGFPFFHNPYVTINVLPVEESYAGFGQVTYNFSSQWQLLAGARVNYDDKTISGRTVLFVPPVGPSPVTGEAKSTVPTGKVSLNYFPDDDTTLYASYSRGYKAGGTNPVAPTLFSPEKINAYEVGWKESFFDKTLRVSSAAFYYDYSDMQVLLDTTNPFLAASGQQTVQNIPKATIYGAELEAVDQIGPLVLNGSVGYTHGRIDQGAATDFRYPLLGVQNLDGRPVAYAPLWTANIGATYVIPLSFGFLAARAEYSYTAKQYAYPFEVVDTQVGPPNQTGNDGINDALNARGLLDLHLTLKMNNGFTIEGYGTNMTNKVYNVGGAANLGEILGAPRQYGARVTYTF